MTPPRWTDPEAADTTAFGVLIDELRAWEWVDVPCAVCEEATALAPGPVKHGITMSTCKCCGNVFVRPAMPPEAVAHLYSERYWELYKRGIGGPTAADRLEHDLSAADTKLKRDVLPFRTGGRMLDVGASTGALVHRARCYGFDAVGVEPSAEACRLARSHFNVDLHQGTLEDHPFEPGFSIVTLHDVLEHVTDPPALLRATRGLMTSGGIVAIETPTTSSIGFKKYGADWPMVLPLEHINLLNEHNTATMLREAGFRIIDLYSPHEDNLIAIAEAR